MTRLTRLQGWFPSAVSAERQRYWDVELSHPNCVTLSCFPSFENWESETVPPRVVRRNELPNIQQVARLAILRPEESA